MAIYHFNVKAISRAKGSSALAAAAYRSASRLYDARLNQAFDFTDKAGVVHSEVMAPEGSPERWLGRERLWNDVEAREIRKDARVANEIEFAIPCEMNKAQGIELAREFVRRECVDRGMIADVNLHWDQAPDGRPKPHAHVMLTTRTIALDASGSDGFGLKVREWTRRDLLIHWREAWAGHVNTRLAQLDIEAWVDHRTFEAQGIRLEPQDKIGPAASRREARAQPSQRAQDHRAIARRNGESIIAEPRLALEAITREQCTFTDHDIARLIHRHSCGRQQFDRAFGAVKASPELVALGRDSLGRARFTSSEMLGLEQRLEAAAETLASRRGHCVSPATERDALAAGERRGLVFGIEQRAALRNIAAGGDLAMVVGSAGPCKSGLLDVARRAWEMQGCRVRGAALCGAAAARLEAGSGIQSRALTSLERDFNQGREALTERDVLVIDDAGLMGSRQMERLMAAAERVGAKVVLVGDHRQAQAIETGAAFRALIERHGAALTEGHPQTKEWQRAATRELASGRTHLALDRYEAEGRVLAHGTREAARAALVEGWFEQLRAEPDATQIMLASARADVAELSRRARARMRAAGELGDDHWVRAQWELRAFARGDRLLFLRADRLLGVSCGALGTLEQVDGANLTARFDADGRRIAFHLTDYADFDHGYSAMIAKSQAVTVDHTHLLATDDLDRHMTYVGMSRHRKSLTIRFGADEFEDRAQLAHRLGRKRLRDATADYSEVFAERRGLSRPARELIAQMDKPASERPDFAAIQPRPAQPGERAQDPDVDPDIRRYARAFADLERMARAGLPASPRQTQALKLAAENLERSQPNAQDIRSALSGTPGLAGRIDQPGGRAALRGAVARETAARLEPMLRAERFVELWTGLNGQRLNADDRRGAPRLRTIEARMRGLAKALERDPQVEAVLGGRRADLGLPPSPPRGLRLGKELAEGLGLSRSRGLER